MGALSTPSQALSTPSQGLSTPSQALSTPSHGHGRRWAALLGSLGRMLGTFWAPLGSLLGFRRDVESVSEAFPLNVEKH